MQAPDNVAMDASLLSVDGEALVVGVGTELTAEDGVMWAASIRSNGVAVAVDEPFELGGETVQDGDGFSFETLTSLLESSQLAVTGVREDVT